MKTLRKPLTVGVAVRCKPRGRRLRPRRLFLQLQSDGSSADFSPPAYKAFSAVFKVYIITFPTACFCAPYRAKTGRFIALFSLCTTVVTNCCLFTCSPILEILDDVGFVSGPSVSVQQKKLCRFSFQ